MTGFHLSLMNLVVLALAGFAIYAKLFPMDHDDDK